MPLLTPSGLTAAGYLDGSGKIQPLPEEAPSLSSLGQVHSHTLTPPAPMPDMRGRLLKEVRSALAPVPDLSLLP